MIDDLISRLAAIDAMDSEIVSTNPEHFKSSEKFIKFMDDADIASFGKWMWANGFNTAVVAEKLQLAKLPSAQSETSRIENALYGKSAEEQYDFLRWLMQDYGMRCTDTRTAVIEWLKGENDVRIANPNYADR